MILFVVIYCIYVANIISLPTTTQGCFFYLEMYGIESV